MKKTKRLDPNQARVFPWHVLSFALFPVVALLAHNFGEVAPANAVPPMIISVVGAGILLLLLRVLLRDWRRAGLATTLVLILFFSYGHVYSYLKGITVSDVYIFRHRTLAPIWLVLTGAGVWWASRVKAIASNSIKVLNAIGLALLILPGVQIGSGLWNEWMAWRQYSGSSSPTGAGGMDPGQTRPDIYYIILDSYGRADVLQELYGYDNSEFISSLENMGFYVADCSQSNYALTFNSLASSLNYTYLDVASPSFTAAGNDRTQLGPFTKHNAVRFFLRDRGYKFIAFETGYPETEITDADLYLTPIIGRPRMNDFEYMLAQTTAGRILLDAEALGAPNTKDYLARLRTEFALEKLQEFPSMAGPKFVFAHLIIPHTPFVFGPNGERISVEGDPYAEGVYGKGYIDQIIYINKQMEHILPEIIAGSSTPPVIILQGDHGPITPNIDAHMANLSAYYLPGHQDLLYPTVTPVNTFRIVLDAYFGQDLPLLPDVSYYSTYKAFFDYTEVQNTCLDTR